MQYSQLLRYDGRCPRFYILWCDGAVQSSKALNFTIHNYLPYVTESDEHRFGSQISLIMILGLRYFINIYRDRPKPHSYEPELQG